VVQRLSSGERLHLSSLGVHMLTHGFVPRRAPDRLDLPAALRVLAFVDSV
jgi:hypothetical protein